MGPERSSAGGGMSRNQDKAFADMIQGLKNETIARGATALLDDEMGSFGVPNPRILIVGCGGLGQQHTQPNYSPRC